MSEIVSEQDRLKLAQAADHVHRMKEECYRANRELEKLRRAEDATLLAMLGDRARPTLSRRNALIVLVGRDHLRRDGTLSRIMLPLLDDPDEDLARMAIEYGFIRGKRAPPGNPPRPAYPTNSYRLSWIARIFSLKNSWSRNP